MEDGTDWATATIYIAVAMALTSPFKHIALSAAVSWHQQNQLHWQVNKVFYSNCYQNKLNETAEVEFTVNCVDLETQTTAETKKLNFQKLTKPTLQRKKYSQIECHQMGTYGLANIDSPNASTKHQPLITKINA